MWSSRLTLAVVLYLSLDLATPTAPGIVPLPGLSLEPAEVCRTRGCQAPAPPLAHRSLFPVVPEREEPSPREVRRVTSTSTLRVILFRPSLESGSPAPPSSADDD